MTSCLCDAALAAARAASACAESDCLRIESAPKPPLPESASSIALTASEIVVMTPTESRLTLDGFAGSCV